MPILSRFLSWIGLQPAPPPAPVSTGGLVRFLVELSGITSAAVYRFGLLEQVAAEWLRHREHLLRKGPLPPDDLQARLQDQTRILEALEAFLAAWARVSLILFPASRRSSARGRAKALRTALSISQASALTEHHLRDAWMHLDERLDDAGTGRDTGAHQLFARSSEVTRQHKLARVRILEVNTLIVWCHDRRGRAVPSDLRRLARGLSELLPRIEPAAARLRAGYQGVGTPSRAGG